MDDRKITTGRCCRLLLAAALLLSGCGSNGDKSAHDDVIDTIHDISPSDIHAKHHDTQDTATSIDESETTRQATAQRDTADRVESFIFGKKERIFTPEQLVGEWVNGTLHEVYYSDSTGLQWDTKDDVSKAEAQRFRWEMKGNNLTQIYRMELGGVVPRDYKVTMVDDESLVYKDNFGIVFMWDKLN
ncbi:MAG: hypothetical protein IJR13_01965 [Bacteroidales bacterium]|nr:hypothetical protein [Bacteroidales bacterium]